ncbi:hypothetical protein OG311_36785 [Streptomyces sp. NBC_01343]|uniref:hypothetical protein n=1 Tax=Streptomyces sp. NBC_01343 TaxID=2903832 RepID=UPI002E12A88D|nr:hypothetical protein OG311_36785 [Streptomyces sp. NBC_01343]
MEREYVTAIDVALAAPDVTAIVFVMYGDGRSHRRHLLAEARRHLALVLRGRRREPAPAPDQAPPAGAADPDQPSPAGAADPDTPPLPLDAGEWHIPRVPLRHDRAVIASTMPAAQLRTARRTGRLMYDVTARRQAAMPEQLLASAGTPSAGMTMTDPLHG